MLPMNFISEHINRPVLALKCNKITKFRTDKLVRRKRYDECQLLFFSACKNQFTNTYKHIST